MSDLIATLKALRTPHVDSRRLNPEHVASLVDLGHARLERGPWGQTQVKLTATGRAKVAELDGAASTPSPVGPTAARQLSDSALIALDQLHGGTPPNDLAGQVLTARGLAVSQHGILSLTRRGADVLHSASTQERLRSLRSPYRRG
jgi:hypothetical protein